MKFAAAITLYNPTKDQLSHCMEYGSSFDAVYLVDNSEHYDRSIEAYYDAGLFHYIKMNGNEGLSKAFNVVLDDESVKEFDYLCTLDQDSIFKGEDIKRIKAFIEKCHVGDMKNVDASKIGIIAPIIDYGHNKLKPEGLEERKRVITSGSFINLSAIHRHGIRYDENYFIDKFEIDLCQQLINRGYKIYVLHDAVLHQQLGDITGSRHSSHNPLRHYYLFRNRFYYNKKFNQGIKLYVLNVLQTGKHIFSILAYEPDKYKKLIQLKHGYIDYKNNRMGKK